MIRHTTKTTKLIIPVKVKKRLIEASKFYKRTFPPSIHWVSITKILALFSQIILQKSFIVDVSGPCVAMYSLPEEHPLKKRKDD
jgi:hypothetical protein